jgi:hypothetical protein
MRLRPDHPVLPGPDTSPAGATKDLKWKSRCRPAVNHARTPTPPLGPADSRSPPQRRWIRTQFQSSAAQHVRDVTLRAGSNHDRSLRYRTIGGGPDTPTAPVSTETSTGSQHQASATWTRSTTNAAY